MARLKRINVAQNLANIVSGWRGYVLDAYQICKIMECYSLDTYNNIQRLKTEHDRVDDTPEMFIGGALGWLAVKSRGNPCFGHLLKCHLRSPYKLCPIPIRKRTDNYGLWTWK